MRRLNDRSCFFLQASSMMKWKSSPFSVLCVIWGGGVIPQWSQPPCWTTLQADMNIWTALHTHPTGPLVLQLVALMMTTSVALLHVHSPVWHWRVTNARFRTVQSNKTPPMTSWESRLLVASPMILINTKMENHCSSKTISYVEGSFTKTHMVYRSSGGCSWCCD